MSALRRQMKADIVLRGLAYRTRKSYVEAVVNFFKFYGRSPERITQPECRSYLLHLLQERRLAARRAELSPVPYFHLVFTLPHELNALAQGNPRAIYALLFRSVSDTLIEFGANPRWLGGEILRVALAR